MTRELNGLPHYEMIVPTRSDSFDLIDVAAPLTWIGLRVNVDHSGTNPEVLIEGPGFYLTIKIAQPDQKVGI